VVGLALFGYAVLTCFAADAGKGSYASANTGVGLLLLFLAGYELKVQYQHVLMLLSLMMLTGLFAPFEEQVSERTRATAVETALGGSV
jgi:hypothetical protein